MAETPYDGSYRFAVVKFANALPLTHYLKAVCPKAVVARDVPSALLSRLLSNKADLALMPVADLFPHENLGYVGGLGICADGRVESVLLRCHRPLEQVRTVWLDPASSTSNVLTNIILRQHHGLAPALRYPDAGPPPDAAVVIGDRALCSPPGPCGDYDLAEQWKEMTGLPFVFAVWACRADDPRIEELSQIAHAAKRMGVEAVGELARLEAARLGLPEDRCLRYFTSAVRYDLGKMETEAMRCFRSLWKQHAGELPPRPGSSTRSLRVCQ